MNSNGESELIHNKTRQLGDTVDLTGTKEAGEEEHASSRPNPWLTALQILGIIAIVVGAFWLGTQRELVQRFSQWGYLSSFLISLIGSATVILPAPGLALILALGAHLNPFSSVSSPASAVDWENCPATWQAKLAAISSATREDLTPFSTT